MSQQESFGAFGDAPKKKGGEPYRIERRTTQKRGGKRLSGFAMDITIRVNRQGAYFLDDHNSPRLAMPHNDQGELIDTLIREVERNHREHFGRPAA